VIVADLVDGSGAVDLSEADDVIVVFELDIT